ncbi:1-phosphofructokinase family hexose kinase [Georgenia subflava]|uniref:Phosphofructokinase n=1 Tax=Georgenia subflava TaxID=1622177 RepID=A0A6N7EIR8_9MICO|nr:PfkB family carbohydrate kinase [Georgenia subflava]MPV36627.1 phosphofructokinase [Georgenia subflava]
MSTESQADPSGPVVSVLSVGPLLEITVETTADAPDDPQVHVHPGGQGLWVARMATTLGARSVLCGPFGGETGMAAAALARAEGLELQVTHTTGISAHIIDYRQGERDEIVVMRSPALDRHAQDDIYGTMLVNSMEADVCVITGADDDLGVPASFFGRLAADLRTAGKPVVADLSGDQAREVVGADGVILKISHEELIEGGFADDDSLGALCAAGKSMIKDGLAAIVVSRAADPTLVVDDDGAHLLTPPKVSTRENKGAGDSMTAGIAVGTGRGADLRSAVGLGVAAGALNVTRRGLGTGRRDQIETFAEQVSIEPV